MATVVKNFRIKSGLVVEGATGTINGQNILTETGGDAYILNVVGGATLVKSVEDSQLEVNGSGKLSVKSGVFDPAGSAAAAQSAAEATAASDATSKANAAQSAAITAAATDATTKVAAEAALRVSGDAASVSTAAADATSKANAAQAAAEATASADATSKANAAQSAAISAAATDATTKANAAQSAAISAAATDATTKANAAQAAAEQHADEAVAALVNGAPAVLDTLNELAEALQDNPDIISDLQGIAAGKQDTLTAGANIDITGSTISVTGLDSADISDFNTAAIAATAAAYDMYGAAAAAQTAAQSYADGLAINYDAAGSAAAAQTAAQQYADGLAVNYDTAGAAATAEQNAKDYADDLINDASSSSTEVWSAYKTSTEIGLAQTAAQSYADGLAVNYDAAGVASGLVDDVLDGTTAFTEINVNDEAKHIAATSSSLGSVVVTAYQWAKADFRSGKFLVKIDNGTHNEISEILVTLDSSDNVAITEYAIVGTNGSRGTITASVSGANVQLRVDPVNDSTIKVTGTLLK
jgi:hypothetical protein